ncbi:hypothetical protein [Hoylesella shahii]|uniref:hypothetical protein n=2 Tax=Hoylesella shahii TaxID=228603 RepID=UPI002888FE60|nr:hypothetical protein [Hoylesella shahii]
MALSKCTNNANILNRFYTSPIQAFFASHLNLIHHSPHHVCVVVLFCNSAKAIVKFSRIASHSFNFSKQTMMVFTLNEPNEQSTFEKTTTPLLYIGSFLPILVEGSTVVPCVALHSLFTIIKQLLFILSVVLFTMFLQEQNPIHPAKS